MAVYTGSTELFDGSILIIPSISQASLPQLTIDLLIHSLELKRQGRLQDEGMVVPMVGEDEGDEGGIVSGGIEGLSLWPDSMRAVADVMDGWVAVFGKEGSPYIFFQQRSPTLQSRKQAHIDLLIRFISSHNFSAILLLTSLDPAAATTEDHLLSPLQVLLSPSTSARTIPADLAERLSRIPQYVPPTQTTEPTYPPFLPNGGLTRRLLATLHSDPAIPPHATLAYWCAEADNRADAFRYAGIVTYLLGIPEEQVTLTQPPSWRGLFGAAIGGMSSASDIYG